MRILTLIFSTFLMLLSTPLAQAESQNIAIIVNEDAISTADFNDRLYMVLVSSGLPNKEEIREQLSGQVASSLIEEQLKIQEARRLNIEISDEEIQSGFAAIAKQNNMPLDNFKEMLVRSQINTASMERQIRAQIAWTKVIQSELRPKIKISQKDVNSMLDLIKSNEGKSEYLVAEIFLPVENPKQEKDVMQLATRLSSDIQTQKTPFFKVAQQFSKAAGSFKGGDLGWIQEGQMTRELDEAVRQMETGQVSQPIRSINGYHIVMLRDKRQISSESLPSYDDVASNIGLQRLERMQRRHYLDIKESAFIESRV